jgi:hypothetical protein
VWKHSEMAERLGLPRNQDLQVDEILERPTGWHAKVRQEGGEVLLPVVMWAQCSLTTTTQGAYAPPETVRDGVDIYPMVYEKGVVLIPTGLQLLLPPQTNLNIAWQLCKTAPKPEAQEQVREHAYVPVDSVPLTARIEAELRGLLRAAVSERGVEDREWIERRFRECLRVVVDRFDDDRRTGIVG